MWSRVNWVQLLLQAQRIDWRQDVAGPHLARGDPLAAMDAVYKELRGLQENYIPLGREGKEEAQVGNSSYQTGRPGETEAVETCPVW